MAQLFFLYLRKSFWVGVGKKTSKGVEKSVLVFTNPLLIVRLAGQSQIESNKTDSKDNMTVVSIQDSFANRYVDTLRKNISNCQASLSADKVTSVCDKFYVNGMALGSNLASSDVIPRFADAGTKVVGSCVKVAYMVFDAIFR